MTNNQIWSLVARKLSGEASLDEIRQLDKLMSEDPELAYRIELYTNFFEHPANADRPQAAKQNSWQRLNARLQQEITSELVIPKTKQRSLPAQLRKYWMPVAASFIALVLLSAYFLTSWSSNTRVAANDSKLLEMNTMPGSRSKTVLPDGTQVWLNSDSRITYNAEFGKFKREITLTGEAFFDVTHNERIPMVVHARSVNILVKGTAFNVRSYLDARDVETSLIRGSVELSTDAEPEKKILLKPNEKISIEAEPMAPAGRQTPKTVDPVVPFEKRYRIDRLKESHISNTIPEVSWIENKLVFDNEPFSAIIAKMEKWYNAEITLTNDSLASKKFSGEFEKENLTEALNALQFINHFEFEIKGKQVFIK